MTGKITFEKATFDHKEIIFSWLAELHVQEFWDNTQGHKDDILNFMEGRKSLSSYCDGKYVYWVASYDGEPYAMLMTIEETYKDDIGELKLSHLSKTGHTYGIDYMIGNTKYFGKGCGVRTLREFIDYLRDRFDEKADTFLLDPAADNPKAKHVYEKAGFKHTADFIMGGDCSGSGKLHHLLIKKLPPKVELIRATPSDKELLENLTHLFIYELSPYYPFEMSPNGKWNKKSKIEKYLTEDNRSARLMKIGSEVIGFVLINQIVNDANSNYNLAEFFILSRFQRYGLGSKVAQMIWNMQPGIWEVMTLPNNIPGSKFWDSAIEIYLGSDKYKKEIINVPFDNVSPRRLLYTFDSRQKVKAKPIHECS